MIIKSSKSVGNILKIEHDIFEQISIFLLTFQYVPQMPQIFRRLKSGEQKSALF